MRALVLSGGGSHGAYENGAIQWLLGKKAVKYDLLCGISVGALNCALLSMFPLGLEKTAALALQTLWDGIDSNSKIFKEHIPFGRLQTPWKSSVVNSQPLLDLINKQYSSTRTREAKRKLVVGAVSLSTGYYTEFNEEHPHIKKAVQASSAYPVFFKPVAFDNQLWSDGGIKTIAPLDAAVHSGATEIDVIVTGPTHSPYWGHANPNALEIALRVLDLTYEEVLNDDLHACLTKFPKTKITVLRPKATLPGLSIDFGNPNRAIMEELGYADAQVTWP